MKIAVNTRLLLPDKLDGIGWFTYQTLKRLTQKYPQHQFLFLFDRPYEPSFIFSENVFPIIIPPPTRHPVLWFIWLKWQIPRIIDKYKPDVFLSPDGFIPLSLKIPSVAVIHDINFHHRPHDLPFASRIYYRYFFPRFAKVAKRVVTVSEFSKLDISQSYQIAPEKIDVVYNGSHEFYKPITNKQKNEVKAKYAEGADFFIFIGSLHPRKNVDGLLKAFDLFKKQTTSAFKLIIVGEKLFKNRILELIYEEMEYKKDVIFAGRKEPDELAQILAAAWALVFVPHFEGFGIPLLEAMHCNVPSIASNVTSLPEVAGETALYVNPTDTVSVSDGLLQMATNFSLREKLISKCLEQRQKFSWDMTADKLWEAVEKATKDSLI